MALLIHHSVHLLVFSFFILSFSTSGFGDDKVIEKSQISKDSIIEREKSGNATYRDIAPDESQEAELEELITEQACMALGRPVRVVITQQKRLDGWVFLVGRPQEVNGDPLDYSSTSYATASANGWVDNVLMALVHQTAGRWVLSAFSLGATDAPFFDWSDRFGVPISLFSMEEK